MRKRKNSRPYWNLKSINTFIKNILQVINENDLIPESCLYKLKNNTSLLEFISQYLKENFQNYSRIQKQVVKKILNKIEVVETIIYYLIEDFMYFLKPFLYEIEVLDPSGTSIDKIKHKIKCAIEKYNDKWTTLETRIKTDIRRELRKLQKQQFVCFSDILDDDIFFNENRLLERKFNFSYNDMNNNILNWNFLSSPSPEDLLILKEEELI